MVDNLTPEKRERRPAIPAEDLVQVYMAMRADALSIVRTAEKALADLGYQVETAVRPRQERRCKTPRGGGVDVKSSID